MRLLLFIRGRRTRRLRQIAVANQYRQTRIFCEPRVLERKLTHQGNRSAIRLDPARMLAALAKAGVGVGRSVGDLGRNPPIVYSIPNRAILRTGGANFPLSWLKRYIIIKSP